MQMQAEGLNNEDMMRQIDAQNMLGLIESLPEQCEEAERIARSMPLPNWPVPANIVILGMGGSAIGGDLARALVEEDCGVPIALNRNYDIPSYVGKQTLVIASSYSGNTEETLSAYQQAYEKGARILVISTGGRLTELAGVAGWPVIRIPGGLSPRAALGYSFIPLLVTLERFGLIPEQRTAIAEMVAILKQQRSIYGSKSPIDRNPAKALAMQLVDRAPVIIGWQGWQGMAAYRWKCQVNENGKAPAFWNVFPELNHNETVGWTVPDKVLNQLYVILLRDKQDDPRRTRRIDVTKQMVSEKAAGVWELWAEGESRVARLFSLIYPGDFTSAYLALMYGMDPTPISAIDHLKSEMSKL
jgi:glucose/mannose-6-phosphate isomerase